MLTELEDLEHHLDLANKATLIGASSEEKATALRAMDRIRNKLDRLEASVVREFEATGEHRAEGHGSSVDWRKHHAKVKGPAASRSRRLAGWLSDLPVAAEAMRDGVLTVDHLQVLHRAFELLGEDVFASLEEGLVDAAVAQRFGDFEHTVEYWIVRSSPATAAERERRIRHDRQASATKKPGGSGRVKADLDVEGFHVVDAELARLCEHLLDQDRAEARDRLGREPLPSELRRTPRQRRADAMRLMAERSAAYGDQDLPAAPPMCLNVFGDVTTVALLLERIIEALGSGEPFDIDQLEYTPDSLHELEDGTVVTLNTILLALLTGVVRGVLFDPEGEVIRWGRGRRLFGPMAWMVRGLVRRCAHPYGCDRTGRQLQCDHEIEWDDGGVTDLWNGTGKCGPHNRWKTNHKNDPPPKDPDQGWRRRPPKPDTGPPPST